MPTNTDQIARYTTLTLAVIGALLAIAEDIKNIPFLADYSHYATAFIGAAIGVKQVILILQKHLGPPSQP